MNYRIDSSRSGSTIVTLIRVLALSAIVFSGASTTLAQYQLRKTTTPTQQKASITITDPSANATWDKGQRYTIKWTSEGRVPSVKIVLIDQANKTHDIVRGTTNSGSYTYTVSTRLADGAYKVVVMTADGSVKGESSGTIMIQKKSFGTVTPKTPPAGGGSAEQPESPAIGQRSLPGTALPSGQTATQQSGSQLGDLTATKDEDKDSPGLMDHTAGTQTGGVTGADNAATSVVVGNLPIAQVSAAEGSELDLSLLQPVEEPEPSSSDALGEITFIQPHKEAVWAPGEQYQISWTGEGIVGPIHLVLSSSGLGERRVVTTGVSANGSLLYTVPSNLKLGRKRYFLWAFDEDSTWIRNRVNDISVYETQPVDLMCKIKNDITNHYFTRPRGTRRYYYFEPSGSREVDFDIAVINDGTSGPLTVPILVRLIKQPENVIIYQMQAGFGDVYPGAWYMTNGAIHWDIRDLEEDYTSGSSSGIDFGSGYYQIIVAADVGNSLGEREELRHDNVAETGFRIGRD